MISVKAIYTGNSIHFLGSENLKFKSKRPQLVIVTFIDEIETELDHIDLKQLLLAGSSFEFLNSEDEDIYTDNDLKIK